MVSRRLVLQAVPLAAATALPAIATLPATAALPGTRVAPDAAAVDAAAAAVRDFSADAYRALALAGDPYADLVCSPYSVAVALAMARAGASGTTASEMDAVLHAPDPAPRALDAGLNALDQLMVAGYQDPGGDGTTCPQLAVANSLWTQLDLSLEPAFRETLTGYYGADAHPVDFRVTEAARQEINTWIGDRTGGKIPELLAPGVLAPLTKLVLANAIYLKAGWRFPFDVRATAAAPFTRDDGETATVAMMAGTVPQAGYLEGDSWLAVDVPYVGSGLAMAVVVPTRGRLADVEAAIDGAWLTRLLRGFHPTTVQLRLPRWRFRLPTELGGLLARLGMPTAFTPRADFSGITSDVDLCIDRVVHEAFIAVDERGTEAAAATAIVLPPSAQQPRPVQVDRPFLFVIHDLPRVTPLFIGRVGSPEGAGQPG